MALDKCPGIQPIGIGEIWRRLLAKCVLKVTDAEAKDACGNAQLCTDLKAGIKGAVHAARALFSEKEDKEEWRFLFVNTANAFNTSNRIACLWTVQHRWPSGVRFSLNCYRHQALLLVRADDGYAGHWLWSHEGILYGIGMLPLTLQMKAAVPTALPPWYADDVADGGSFEEIKKVFNLLMSTEPARGYFPEPTKSILVVKPAMVQQAKTRFDHLGFTVVTGTRYMGGFIGTTADESSHI